ncbi:MAG TPA: AraC family transcriptional regulator [Chitinophagaceae bacterium]|nr:AraC family transcriptional regulator [Chitinophagaceae bacterium]
MKLYIRNMACESCIVVVKNELKNVGAVALKVELGEAEVKGRLAAKKIDQFNTAIKKAGLEVVQNKEAILVDQIKTAIHDYITNIKSIKINLSDYLGKKLDYDYTYLSSYFSALSATTIEQYTIALKIERAKEMLLLEDCTLKQIADKLSYSSVSHLSNQFKKVTGLPASHFKQLKNIRRKTIQQL